MSIQSEKLSSVCDPFFPAKIGRFTPGILFNVAREVPALWVYYFRTLRV